MDEPTWEKVGLSMDNLKKMGASGYNNEKIAPTLSSLLFLSKQTVSLEAWCEMAVQLARRKVSWLTVKTNEGHAGLWERAL